MQGTGTVGMDLRTFWDFDDLPASKARLEAALAAATAPQDQAIWLTQLARMAGLKGDFTQGELLLDQAEAIGPTAATAARITLERARLAREEGPQRHGGHRVSSGGWPGPRGGCHRCGRWMRCTCRPSPPRLP